MADDFRDDTNEPRRPKEKSSKLWLWLGCLPVGVLLVCCGGCGGVVMWGISQIKSSDPYVDSFTRAQNDPEVIAALGEPIEAGWAVQGEISVTNDDGNANLDYDISGPKGTGTVHVTGEKNNGVWTYSIMSVDTPGGQVDLLDPHAGHDHDEDNHDEDDHAAEPVGAIP